MTLNSKTRKATLCEAVKFMQGRTFSGLWPCSPWDQHWAMFTDGSMVSCCSNCTCEADEDEVKADDGLPDFYIYDPNA